jgi:hypothetical protein
MLRFAQHDSAIFPHLRRVAPTCAEENKGCRIVRKAGGFPQVGAAEPPQAPECVGNPDSVRHGVPCASVDVAGWSENGNGKPR